jgi:hypothetical protein
VYNNIKLWNNKKTLWKWMSVNILKNIYDGWLSCQSSLSSWSTPFSTQFILGDQNRFGYTSLLDRSRGLIIKLKFSIDIGPMWHRLCHRSFVIKALLFDKSIGGALSAHPLSTIYINNIPNHTFVNIPALISKHSGFLSSRAEIFTKVW